ncbi:MAG: hypothetical protein KBG48_35070 [Kofleriaceae bacterium]|nr:hypothetical protein [Kofleriaceae bacterium]MBP9172634.1 hypothetical protein [Kofleriaceae bacterium]MBP9863034.1 hypothetical protein [Kofleriaceae bacterium]
MAKARTPTDGTLALALHHAARLTARMVNDTIADELARRNGQLAAPGGLR